jgi:hypothetical protein
MDFISIISNTGLHIQQQQQQKPEQETLFVQPTCFQQLNNLNERKNVKK